MIRFFLIAMLWMAVSFGLMLWVQKGVDRMHRDAVEAVGKTISFPEGTPPPSTLVEAMNPNRASPQDMARIEFDRMELMRRLRVMWITVTLTPVLIGAWWAVKHKPLREARVA